MMTFKSAFLLSTARQSMEDKNDKGQTAHVILNYFNEPLHLLVLKKISDW